MSPELRRELRLLLGLAGPLVASYAGQQAMSLVDTVLVGHLGRAQTGGVGIGNGLYSAALVVGVGLVLGLDPLIAQALGAGEPRRARSLLWQGVRVAAWSGLVLTALLYLVPMVLGPAGVKTATAIQTRRYLLARAPGLMPFLLYSAARSYLQAMGVTRPILWAMVVGNIINLALGLVLTFGAFGVPGLGVVGTGIASTGATLASLWIMARAVRMIPLPPGRGKITELRPALVRSIIRLGGPLGLQFLIEVSVFAMAGLMAGRLGDEAAAAHSVALTLASMTFTVALGIGAATAVRVGRAVGAGEPESVRRAGLAGLLAAWGFMALMGLLFFAIPGVLGRALSPEAGQAAVPLVLIAAFFQLSDGTQCVAAAALRGAGDTRASMLANLVGHYAIGLPLSMLLGFRMSQGAPGLWWGLSAGLTAVAIGLVLRFLVISKRPIARAA